MPIEYNRAHPDVSQPWAEWSEEQTLHLVLVYNNPFRWKSRRQLMNDAVRHFLSSPNVIVYLVKLAHDNRPLEAAAENHGRRNLVTIPLSGDCEIWQKENLINLGVRHFPAGKAGWKNGAYWDADFVCTRYDWALEAIHMLQHFQFVQLFNTYVDLTPETSTSWDGHRPYRMNTSFAWNYNHQDEFYERRKNWKKGRREEGTYYLPLPEGPDFPFGLPPGATGGGWAWRRQAFTTVGGWPERCPLGSGDWHAAFGLINQFGLNVGAEQAHCTPEYIRYIQNWIENAQRLQGHPGKGVLGCIDNFAVHHFHGSKANRAYGERWQILQRHKYDPFTDLTPDWQGILRWSGNKPKLRDDVRRYFLGRNEERGYRTRKTAPLNQGRERYG